MNNKKSAIPTDTEKLKDDCWMKSDQIKAKNQTIKELKEKLIHAQAALILMEGLLFEMDSKRKEPGLLENIEKRLKIELVKARSGMKIAAGE